MNKIKEKFIRLLGGMTGREFDLEEFRKGEESGRKNAYNEMREYMKGLNGMCADDWCDAVWEFVNDFCSTK